MFRELVTRYLMLFQEKGEQALVIICNCKIPGDIILKEYNKLPPIESLPEEDKKDLWQYAKQIYPDGDNETKLRFIKITYTIGTLL